MSNTRQDIQSGEDLAERVYDTIAEPNNLEDFLVAWENYVDASIDRAPNSDDDRGEVALHTSFARGMSIFNRIGRSNSTNANLQSLVDSLAGISLITDRMGRILAQNKHAINAIQSDVDRGDKPLDGWLAGCIATWRRDPGGGGANYLFSRYESETGDFQRNFLTVLVKSSEDPLIAVEDDKDCYLTSSVDLAVDNGTAGAIQTGFGLSKAETEIALQIMQGEPPAKIAEKRGVSLHTIRSQIRSLLAKTDSQGLSDLVRLLCSYAVKHASLDANISFRNLTRENMNPAVGQFFKLDDGRTMHYRDMGDPNGAPVLFFHSIICGTELTEHAIDTCTRAGIRIIAPSLPGYWKSSPNPGVRREDLLKANAADCVALLRSLNIDQVVTMGHIVGAASAQAFAAYHPNLVKGVVMVGHAGHFDPAFFKEMGSVHRAMGKTIMYAPKALAFIVRAVIALIDADDEEKLIKTTHNPSEFDKLSLKRPDIKDVVIRGIREGVMQGGDAFTQYSEVSMMDWLHHARRIKCPVTIFFGERDELITEKYFTPYLTQRPDAKLVRLPDAGKYMLSSHWLYVLGELRDMSASGECA